MSNSIKLSALFILTALFVTTSITAADKLITLKNMDDDAEEELVLENKFCQLVVKPSAAGAGISLKSKPSNTELLARPGRPSILVDVISQQGPGGDFNAPYSYVISENSNKKAVVTLTCRGTTRPILNWITIKKTLTIHADRPVINASIEIENHADSMQPFKLGYWSHNIIGVVGKENRFFVPVQNGVQIYPVTTVSNMQDYWHYDMARGWIADLSEDGVGVAMRMKYSDLMAAYQYMKGTTFTMEWLSRSKEISDGKSITHNFDILPLAGISRVDGVCDNGIAGEIIFDGIPVPGRENAGTVKLMGTSGKAELEVSWRGAQEKDWRMSVKGRTEIREGKAAFGFKLSPPKEGIYGIRCIVKQNNKQIGIIERTIKLGASSEKYVMAIESKPEGDLKESMQKTIPIPGSKNKGLADSSKTIKDLPDDIPYEMKNFSPHIPWARPYHKGKTRVFVIMQTQVGREMLEFAQRMDMELKTVTYGSTSWKAPNALVKGWSNIASEMHIKKILREDPIDVLVLRTRWWPFSDEVKNMIKKRVKAGMGLVYVGVAYETNKETDPELYKMVSQGKFMARHNGDSRYFNKNGFPDHWEAAADHYIAGALPWQEIKTQTLVYEQTTGKPVVIWKSEKHGDVPLIVTSKYGEGRVACVNYESHWFPGRGDHLVPNMYSGQNMNRPDESKYEQKVYRYHVNEYAWALLSRCTLWAAQRESELYIEDASAKLADNKAKLTINMLNKGKSGRLMCELTLRNEDSKILMKKSELINAAAGKSTLDIEFDSTKIEGMLNFVEFRLLNNNGVVDFGATALKTPAPKVTVTVDKALSFAADKKPSALVDIKGKIPAETNLIISIEDGNGRVISETDTGAITKNKASHKLETLSKLGIPEYYVRASLLNNGKVIADDIYRAVYEVPVNLKDWLYCVETYQGYYNFWAKLEYQKMRDLGIRGCHTMANAAHTILEMRSAGWEAGDVTGFMYKWKTPKNHNKKVAQYRRTGDVKHLVREYDLHDPAYRAMQKKRIEKLTPLLRAAGIWDNTIIDEYDATSGADYSFAEPTLVKFREWAKTQYKDLNELNAAYGRNYAAWDEVLPLTIEQARKAGKFAGWVDLRRFIELSSIDFWSWVHKELLKHNPAAKISLSGTQSPTPYKGHDVWLRCKTFDGVWSYHGGAQDVMMRSFGSRRKKD
ncbi:MAG: beta-galactosidase, partial [Planctomycetota bacterium]